VCRTQEAEVNQSWVETDDGQYINLDHVIWIQFAEFDQEMDYYRAEMHVRDGNLIHAYGKYALAVKIALEERIRMRAENILDKRK